MMVHSLEFCAKFLVVGVAFPAAEGSRVFANAAYDYKLWVWNYLCKTRELEEQRETGVRKDDEWKALKLSGSNLNL